MNKLFKISVLYFPERSEEYINFKNNIRNALEQQSNMGKFDGIGLTLNEQPTYMDIWLYTDNTNLLYNFIRPLIPNSFHGLIEMKQQNGQTNTINF